MLFFSDPRTGTDVSSQSVTRAPREEHFLTETYASEHSCDLSSEILPEWEHSAWIVVDLETTGLDDRDTITEIGACLLVDDTVTERFHSLVNPGRPLPDIVVKITGLTDDLLAAALPLSDVFPRFASWFNAQVEAFSPAGLVAHNVTFDRRFLLHAEKLTGSTLRSLRLVDTLSLARRYLPRPIVLNHRLGTLADFYRLAPATHRASSDVEATAGIFLRLLAEAREEKVTSFEKFYTVAAPAYPLAR